MTAQPSAPATPRVTLPPGAWQRILAALAMDGDTAKPHRPHTPPVLPPGVVPSGRSAPVMDSAGGIYSWLNTPGGAFCGMGFQGYQYLAELAQRSEYRAPVETIANEMTRKWIRFTGGDEAKREELQKAFKDFAVREVCRLAIMHDGFFGRGQIYPVIKGQDTPNKRKLPLHVDEGGIAKGSLLGFKNIEPIWTTPLSYNSGDPTLPDFYRPTKWFVMGVETDATRLLTFIARPLPDVLKPGYNFSGLSLQQLIEPYVQRWLKTVDSINRLLSRFSYTYLKTNLAATLQQADHGATSLNERAKIFTTYADLRGLGLIDKDTEDFGQLNTPLSGLSELQAQAQEHMAAPTHIPLVFLTGITPSGLNASSEGEIKVFYNYLAGEQQNLLDPNLRVMMHMIMLHLWGKIDDDIGYEWVPLDSPKDTELAIMRKDDAASDVSMVGAGILDPMEVRERLRADPNSGYVFIEPADAPPSPLEAEAELGEQGAQADHERGEESAEAAHERAKEMAKIDKPVKGE